MKPDEGSERSKGSMETPAARSLQDWIERARNGDPDAFRVLVDLHRDRAYALALRIVRVPADAEEVAQDAFVRVWRALPHFRGDAALSTWLHRIVVRLAIDRAARLRGLRQRETSWEERAEEISRAPETVSASDAGERLEQLMSELSEAQRAVVALYYYRDHAVDDVARLLGMPENTVKTHLSRARAALRLAWGKAEPR
jgi:RNA polymerase sigma-70 factor (ECF subfamily)